MSDDQPEFYRLDQAKRVNEQFRAIAAVARKQGKLRNFIAMMKRGVELLRTDPHG